MTRYENLSLKNYNTLRVDAIAKELYIPENEIELCELIKDFTENEIEFYILGNGSNVLFKDDKIIERKIIYLGKANDRLEYNESTGVIDVGCSVRLQALINDIHSKSLGGIEYLYSVPAFVGGAIAMNAGRGKKYNKAISDYLIKVKVFDGQSIREIEKDECIFSHRDSIFQHNNWCILSGQFKFPEMNKEVGDALIKERIAFCKENQDTEKPNAGTIFRKGNKLAYKLLMGSRCGGAMYSKKTLNWIINFDNASSKDILKLINRAKLINKILFSKTSLEIRIVD